MLTPQDIKEALLRHSTEREVSPGIKRKILEEHNMMNASKEILRIIGEKQMEDAAEATTVPGPHKQNPDQLNILFLGNFEAPYSSENYYKKTLEQMGHKVMPVQEGKANKSHLLQHKNVDLFFWVHTHGWRTPGIEDALAIFKNAGIPSFGYHLDLYMPIARWQEYNTGEYMSKLDYFFTAEKKLADWLNEKTETKAFYMPAGVYAGETNMGIPDLKKYPEEIIFTGAKNYHSEWPYRTELIDWLQKTYGSRFTFYGHGGKPVVRGPELNNLYASAKIVIGDTLCPDFTYQDYFSDRLFEVTGRWGFMIFPFIAGLGDLFNINDPDKELETYTFGNFDELKEKIDYYLTNEDERNQVRLRGYQRCVSNHTYTHRLREILKVVVKK